MESQVTTRFQVFAEEQQKELLQFLSSNFQPYNLELELYRHLVYWKHKHNKYKQFKREDFCIDGFMCNVQNNSHTILYVFDYKYSDRQARRRMYKMQNFISNHCFDKNINISSTSTLILNKTNSKCVSTESYVKKFEKYILQEMSIIRPTIIVAIGCYDIVSNLFQKYKKSDILSAIKYIPIIDIPPINLNVSDKLYQVHFEYVYFRKFGWNI